MRKRNLIMLIVMTCWLLGGFFINDIAPITYEKQIDARKRAYINATVINKYYSEGCSKSSCYRNYYFVIELLDGTIVDHVSVTSEFYESQTVGSVTSFERHIADPIIVEQQATRGALYLTWLIGIMVLCTMWVVVNFLVSRSKS